MRRLGLLVVLLVLSGVYGSIVASGSSVCPVKVSVSMLVPAVSHGDGGFVGVVSRLHVVVEWPGEGLVYFSATPLTELDTQAAARMAVLVASMLAGVDYHGYNFYIRLEADSSVIGGPSASGAMAVAVLAALLGVDVPENVSMTGMVEPDSSLGPVGGIPEKLRAAAEAGVRLFIIPAGQRFAVDPNTGERVDVVELGRELGVRVVEAASIAEAFSIITGVKLPYQEPATRVFSYPGWLRERLEKVWEELYDSAVRDIEAASELLGQLGGGAERMVSGLVSEARRALELSSEYRGKGMVYAAASRAFLAAILAGEAYDLAVALMGGRETALRLIEQRLADAGELLRQAQEVYNKTVNGGLTVARLQLLVVARERILSAMEAIERVRLLQASGEVLDAVREAVYAYYRALTARSWAETAADPSAASGPLINVSLVRDLAYTVYYMASTSVSYVESLGAPATGLTGLIEEADRLIAEGDYIGSLSASVSALISATTMLHASFETSVEPRLDAVRSHVVSQMGVVGERGYTPILPVLYIEYGDALRGEGKAEEALGMYIAAAMYALLLYGLIEKGAPVPPGVQPLPATVTERVTETIVETRTRVVTSTVVSERTLTETVEKTVAVTETSPVTVTRPPSVDELLAVSSVGLVVGLAIGALLAYTIRRRD